MKKILQTTALVSISFFALMVISTVHTTAQEYASDAQWNSYTPTYNGNTDYVTTSCAGCTTYGNSGSSYASDAQWNSYTPTYNGNTDYVTTSCAGCTTYGNSGSSYASDAQWNSYTPTYNGNTDYVTTSCAGCSTPTSPVTYTGTCNGCDSASYTGGYSYTPSSSYTPVTYGNSGSSYTPVTYGNSGSSYTPVTYGNSGSSYTPIVYGNSGTTGTVTNTVICPSGTIQNGSNCVNNVSGTVVTTINCPNGTTQNGNTCVNTVTGNVVTNFTCPNGTTQNGNTCVNTITGNVVTNTICPNGTTLTNGQCINTITPPVTTVTNCPSNTQYVNGTCRQVINPPVVTYQTCWDGAVIPATSVCSAQYKVCANGTSVPVNQACYVAPTPVYVPPIIVKFNNVVTSPATEITKTSGRCNAIGLIANNAPSTGWFEYGETANLGRTTASANIGSANTAPFSNVLASLKPTTRYYCRAVMQNQYGLVKGEIVSFHTKSIVTIYVKPVVIKIPIKKPVVTCTDGTTVTVKNTSSVTLINQGQKLITASIEKIDGQLTSGATVHYKVTYKNLADTRLSGVLVKVTLPQEISFVSATAGNYDIGSRTLTLNQDTIDPYSEGVIIITGTVVNDAPIGKTVVTNVYVAYTVPGTQIQDEVTAYVIGSITPVTVITNQDTGVKHVIGESSGAKSFMPNSLIEWLALLAIIFIIFILGRSIYASYKDDEAPKH
jgi:hypothetical protein